MQCRLGESCSGWHPAPAALRCRLPRCLLLGYGRGATDGTVPSLIPRHVYVAHLCDRFRASYTDPCWIYAGIPDANYAGECCGAGASTPTEVADNVLRCIAESQAAQPPMHFFAFVDVNDVRQQAALSTARCDTPAPCQYTRCRKYQLKGGGCVEEGGGV